MKERSEYFDRLSHWTQLPGELQPGKTLVELFGSTRVLIEHHKGLICYSRNSIVVKSGDGCLCISGEDMAITCMTAYQLVICGKIHSVLIKGDGKG